MEVPGVEWRDDYFNTSETSADACDASRDLGTVIYYGTRGRELGIGCAAATVPDYVAARAVGTAYGGQTMV